MAIEHDIYKAAAAKNAAPISPKPIPAFSAPFAVTAADVDDDVADPVLDAPDDDAPVEVVVLAAEAFEDVEAELADVDDESDEAEEAEAPDVTDAEEADDEDEAAAEVAAAPVPVDVRTADLRDPTLATQVPATVLLES